MSIECRNDIALLIPTSTAKYSSERVQMIGTELPMVAESGAFVLTNVIRLYLYLNMRAYKHKMTFYLCANQPLSRAVII